MPGPIDSTAAAGAIASLLRQAMSSTQQVRGTQGKRGTASDKARQKDVSGQQANTPLSRLIVKRAGELDPDAGDYRTRLLRLVIEATLLHELGGNLLNAPKFQSMVDQVLHDLDSAPQMKRDVDMVIERLSSGNWPDA